MMSSIMHFDSSNKTKIQNLTESIILSACYVEKCLFKRRICSNVFLSFFKKKDPKKICFDVFSLSLQIRFTVFFSVFNSILTLTNDKDILILVHIKDEASRSLYNGNLLRSSNLRKEST